MKYGVFEYKGDKIFLLLKEFNNIDDATDYKKKQFSRPQDLLYILREPNLKIIKGDAIHNKNRVKGTFPEQESQE